MIISRSALKQPYPNFKFTLLHDMHMRKIVIRSVDHYVESSLAEHCRAHPQLYL